MNLFDKLIKFLDFGADDRYQKDLERWAKTEYAKDWQWAYNFMLENPGVTPRHSSGVTL
jgi:hypothetical protein